MSGWVEFTYHGKDLTARGLVIPVNVTSSQTLRSAGPVPAVIDTGADTTCVSRTLAEKLGMTATSTEKHHVINGGHVDLAVSPCAIQFDDLEIIELARAGIADIGEADAVLIGRDILSIAQLIVDFTQGSWTLRLDASKLKPPY
jgi:predicted aspartyl protease